MREQELSFGTGSLQNCSRTPSRWQRPQSGSSAAQSLVLVCHARRLQVLSCSPVKALSSTRSFCLLLGLFGRFSSSKKIHLRWGESCLEPGLLGLFLELPADFPSHLKVATQTPQFFPDLPLTQSLGKLPRTRPQ